MSHFVCGLNKGVSENREKKYKLVCLNDNTSPLMVVANDHAYEDIFCFLLEGVLEPRNLFIGIPGSGNSRNIIRTMEYAKTRGKKRPRLSVMMGDIKTHGKSSRLCPNQQHAGM